MSPVRVSQPLAPEIAMGADRILKLPHSFPVVLGIGGFLKNTTSLIDGYHAHVSSDVGHTDTPAAVLAMEQRARRLLQSASGPPAAIAHDLHPDFPSTRVAVLLAAEFGVPLVPVQHHHAHVAAVAAEHGITEPLLGLALDGFGLAQDGSAWGGEFLFIDGGSCGRLGHLQPLLQPGGDLAAREPWRMGAAALHTLGRTDEIPARWPAQPAAAYLPALMRQGLNCPPTSSAGRLFDAVCGLLGICPVAKTEAQAPIALESLVSHPQVLSGGWQLSDGVLDLRPLMAALADMWDARLGANLFHGTLAAAMADWVIALSPSPGAIAFSGGCFHNQVLSADLRARLEAAGFSVLQPHVFGPGDGALSLGQAYVAAQTMAPPPAGARAPKRD